MLPLKMQMLIFLWDDLKFLFFVSIPFLFKCSFFLKNYFTCYFDYYYLVIQCDFHFMYLLAALSLGCCRQVFSSCSEQERLSG